WHLIHITLHVLHATLWYVILKKILLLAENKNAVIIAFFSMLLYCVAPHISEVIVWKASFHFLLAGVMTALNIFWLLLYQETENLKYPIYSSSVFLLSTFSLEVFYLTPWIILL